MKFAIYYIILVNIYGIIIMYIDKEKSKKSKWRVSELKLFLIASAFGSLGIFLGMHMFRHKTKHKKFIYGIPLFMIIQLLIIFIITKLTLQ